MVNRCLECKKEVKKDEHQAVISSLNRYKGKKKLADTHDYFHMDCWNKYFDDRVNRRIESKINEGINILMIELIEELSQKSMRE